MKITILLEKRSLISRRILWWLLAAGVAALVLIFAIPSKAENAWLLGFSRVRVLSGAGFLAILLLLLILAALETLHPAWWQKAAARVHDHLRAGNAITWLLGCMHVVLCFLLVPFLVALLVPAIRSQHFFGVLTARFGSLIGWTILALATGIVILILSQYETLKAKGVFSSGKLALWVLPILAALVYSLQVAVEISGQGLREHLVATTWVLAAALAAWGVLNLVFRKRTDVLKVMNTWFIGIILFLVVYAGFQLFASLMDWVKTPRMTYWHLLAKSFLQGRLDLVDPADIHDLSFFNDKWYVPMYPMPAIVMIPYVLFVDPSQVNSVLLSIFFTALNAVLVYLALDSMRGLGWTRLPRRDLLWLVALFALGTPNVYVGTVGWVWFLSQTLTLTFSALAVLFTLRGSPAWLVGICLAVAFGARPNIALLWPLLLAVSIQVKGFIEGKKVNWKKILAWSTWSILPIVAAGLGLLAYNALRFGNPLDFGYDYMQGTPRIITNISRYGVLNFHYMARNLMTMFLSWPAISLQKPYVIPPQVGMSMFITTPALFFLAGKYERKWWILGAWISVLLSVFFLSMFHNTGASQFGYRYILDFIVPVVMLLAAVLKLKWFWLFRVAVIISIIISILGAIWYYQVILK